jgi:hypothetical protein
MALGMITGGKTFERPPQFKTAETGGLPRIISLVLKVFICANKRRNGRLAYG